MIKLIALDLDGTLLDPSGRITPGAKEAVARAREKGVRVVLNTGRPIPEAIWFAREAGCDNLISCLGGAALVDGSTGMVLRRREEGEKLKDAVKEVAQHTDLPRNELYAAALRLSEEG